MPWVEGVGSVPPSFEASPRVGSKTVADFDKVLDRLMLPQGMPGNEFPQLIKPALTLEQPRGRGIALGPRGPGYVADAGQLFRPLADLLGQVNAQALYSGEMQEAFAAGENVELHDVMIASEKAGIAIQLTTQIRNKLLEAYQEMSRMQV